MLPTRYNATGTWSAVGYNSATRRKAEIYLERVVNTYPDSGAAEIAEELLQEIR